MTALIVFLWIANMLVDTGGQLFFKAAASEHTAGAGWLAHWKRMASRPWLWFGICCYVLEFFVWMAFLSQVELSVGVMLGSFNIVVIMLAGRLFFKEKLSPLARGRHFPDYARGGHCGGGRMKRFYIIGFLILMSFDTLSQISFKYASTQALPLELSPSWLMRLFLNPWLYGAIAGYLGAFVTWMTLLRYAPVGPSFAASHLELISVTLFSVWLFNEPLNAYKILGGVLILLGVLCLAKDEKDDEDEAEAAPVRAGE